MRQVEDNLFAGRKSGPEVEQRLYCMEGLILGNVIHQTHGILEEFILFLLKIFSAR